MYQSKPARPSASIATVLVIGVILILTCSTAIPVPSHTFEFRGCTTGLIVPDVYTALPGPAPGLVATPINSPACSSTAGLTFNGISQYATITSWSWGGTTSFEAYVQYSVLNAGSRVFEFSNPSLVNAVVLANAGTSTSAYRKYMSSRAFYVK